MAYPSETHLYQLDAVGNRTGEKRVASVLGPLTVALFAAVTPAQATAAVERPHNAVDWVTAVVDVKASTTTPLAYDANGNRTAEGAKRYQWDIRDTLTQVEDGAAVLGTYDYDAKLQRVKADTGQGHVEYVLDGKYVLREAGARQRRYHYGEGEALAVTGVGGTGAEDRWLLLDGLGSVSTEVDSTVTAVTARQFDAWGNYRNGTAPTVGETRLGYTGHQYDVETGLTYARARYYDSKLGVFLSRDSFEGVLLEAPSLHRYTYSHNSPLKYRDPTGRAGVRTELAREGQKFYEQAQGLEQQAFQQTSSWRAAGLIGLAAAAKTTGIVAEGLQRAWSGFDWVSGGAIGRLDKVHDAQEASASRYEGEFGTLNYLEDVNKEVTLFAAKSVVQLGAGKVVDKLLPAGGSSAGDIAGRGLERAGLRGAISLTPRVVEHVSGGPELTVSEAVRTVGTKVVGEVAGEAAKQVVGEVAEVLEQSEDEAGGDRRVALGLSGNSDIGPGVLKKFALDVGAERFVDRYGPGINYRAFPQQFEQFVGEADSIHFNLRGMDPKEFGLFMKHQQLVENQVTNYELNEVLRGDNASKVRLYDTGVSNDPLKEPPSWLKEYFPDL
ncbi:MAG: RHS repeat-associated core domain-containing protein [Myxococcaceae bacterium]|nr:RHS repeat-associated core domain-containing protein [Myxococcaceae bacterium]